MCKTSQVRKSDRHKAEACSTSSRGQFGQFGSIHRYPGTLQALHPSSFLRACHAEVGFIWVASVFILILMHALAGCHGLKKDAEVPECGCVLHAIRVHVFTAISCLQHVRTPRTMSDTTSRDYSGAYPTLPSMCCLDLRVYCSKLEQPVGLLDQCLCPGLQGRHEPFR